MKDIFYGLLSLVLLSAILFIYNHKAIYEIPKDITGLVIDKHDSKLMGDNITILKQDSTTEKYVCYDILFDVIETGDSVVNGVIIKNNWNERER